MPGLKMVNESIIHLTSLSEARFNLYPKPGDWILISVKNPLPSNSPTAVAPVPSPPTKTTGGSAQGSPGLSIGISIIPPLSSVITSSILTVGGLNSSNTVSGVSPTPSSRSSIVWLLSVVIKTSTDAPLPVIENVRVSSSSIVLSSAIPTVTFDLFSVTTNAPDNCPPTISAAVMLVPVKL